MEKKYPADLLRRLIRDIIGNVGLNPDMAEVFAATLVSADLRGVKSHGSVRLPSYVQRVENKVLNPKAEVIFVKDEAAVALLDGANGFGQVAGHCAMVRAIEKAHTYGVGLVGVRSSNHFGIASFYAMMALAPGMIGAVLTNASPAMSPYGAVSPLLGTNPIAVAIPAGVQMPIVLDMSTSLVARGKIRYAALTGHEIPLGWATDAHGEPTTDARKALKGSLEPIGGVKGAGLSLIVDILCGILTNSCLTGEVKTIVDISGPAKTGHIFCAVDIDHFIGIDPFKKNMDAVIKRIKSLPSKDGQEVFLPGEIEFNLSEKRSREGIPLEDAVVEILNALAARYQVGCLE